MEQQAMGLGHDYTGYNLSVSPHEALIREEEKEQFARCFPSDVYNHQPETIQRGRRKHVVIFRITIRATS